MSNILFGVIRIINGNFNLILILLYSDNSENEFDIAGEFKGHELSTWIASALDALSLKVQFNSSDKNTVATCFCRHLLSVGIIEPLLDISSEDDYEVGYLLLDFFVIYNNYKLFNNNNDYIIIKIRYIVLLPR